MATVNELLSEATSLPHIPRRGASLDSFDIFKFLSKPSAPSTVLVGTDVYSIDPNGALRVARKDGSGGTLDFSGFDPDTGEPLPRTAAERGVEGLLGFPPPAAAATASAATATAGGLGVASALAASTGGGFDVAFGFPLFSQMTDLILRADANRRATIDQNVSILRLMSDLERVSPTRAASLAAGLGLPEPDLSFLSVLQSGAPAFGRGGAAAGGGTSFGGMVGTQNVSLPSFLSGAQLTNLQANPNIAQIVLDVADRFGRPDLFTQSAAGVVPTSPTLLAAAG